MRKINTGQLLVEFVSVVFAVVLALILNGYREDIKTRKLVKRVKQTLLDETKSNLSRVEDVLAYHSKLATELQNNRHLIVAVAAGEASFNIMNEEEVKKFAFNSMLKSSLKYPGEIKIIRAGDQRFMKIHDTVIRVAVENDTLKLFGTGNIRLRIAPISNHAWQIAQTTDVAVEMDYEIVSTWGETTELYLDYIRATEKALDILYTGNGEILSVLQDMMYYEQSLEDKYKTLITLVEQS